MLNAPQLSPRPPGLVTLALGHAAALAALAAFYRAVAALVRYQKRPAVLALWCLAEWAMLYSVAIYTRSEKA